MNQDADSGRWRDVCNMLVPVTSTQSLIIMFLTSFNHTTLPLASTMLPGYVAEHIQSLRTKTLSSLIH